MGKELQICSYDHKPQFFGEMQRILKNGGQLYRACNNKMTQETEIYYASSHQEFLQIDRIPEESEERVFGPWRVKPGGLSVRSSYCRFQELSETSRANLQTSEARQGLWSPIQRSQSSIILMISTLCS